MVYRVGIWHHVSLELLINKQHTQCHMLLNNKCRCISHNLLVSHCAGRLHYPRADSSSNQSSALCNNRFPNDPTNKTACTRPLVYTHIKTLAKQKEENTVLCVFRLFI